MARAHPAYEERPEQVQLAHAVAATLAAQGRLIAEAGTGVGKTLAYLLPSVLSECRVVISTGTKNLQEQLVRDDLPMLERALGRQVNVQVMKGRTNYLCLVRSQRMASQPFLPGSAEGALYDTIRAWQDTTATGDRAELEALPDDHVMWRELTATSEQCLGQTCHDYERCFVTQMRRRAQAAKLIIVNHHLYFADLALRWRLPDAALLPPHDLVIFDEAHDLDEVAAQHFGHHVSLGRFADLARDATRMAAGDTQVAARLDPLLTRLVQRAQRMFDVIPGGEARTLFTEMPAALLARHREVDEDLEALAQSLAGVAEEEAPSLARRAVALAAELAFVLDVPARRSAVAESETAAAGPYVRYSEQSGRSRQLVARPIDVAGLVGPWLDTMPAVFVSATLAVGGRFEHFRRRLGLTQARELLVGSPFDYRAHTRLYLPDDLPEPDDPEFVSAAAARAAQLVTAAGGGAFVLCTSHRVLPSFADELSRCAGLRVLVQGEAPRAHLVEEFRRDGHAALVATMSFWQGVDVPGSALRLVIIDKLPFASPSDPLLAARLDHLRATGHDPFTSYQLPQAALLLRQGFGRLIRRKTDRGMVAVLDRRLITRRYGEIFLRSLPDCPQLRDLGEAQHFLAALKVQAATGV